MRKTLITIAAVIAVAGCATVFEGTSQEITVNTNPAGASCVFERQGTCQYPADARRHNGSQDEIRPDDQMRQAGL